MPAYHRIIMWHSGICENYVTTLSSTFQIFYDQNGLFEKLISFKNYCLAFTRLFYTLQHQLLYVIMLRLSNEIRNVSIFQKLNEISRKTKNAKFNQLSCTHRSCIYCTPHGIRGLWKKRGNNCEGWIQLLMLKLSRWENYVTPARYCYALTKVASLLKPVQNVLNLRIPIASCEFMIFTFFRVSMVLRWF